VRQAHWKNVAEVIGTGAIIVGLIFVYAELRQNRIIARAELSAESACMFAALDERERDPQFARMLVKSKDKPGETGHL